MARDQIRQIKYTYQDSGSPEANKNIMPKMTLLPILHTCQTSRTSPHVFVSFRFSPVWDPPETAFAQTRPKKWPGMRLRGGAFASTSFWESLSVFNKNDYLASKDVKTARKKSYLKKKKKGQKSIFGQRKIKYGLWLVPGTKPTYRGVFWPLKW